jgi:nucleoside 2-deoxyribosyltransferase
VTSERSIYLAAPLFTPAECSANLALAKALEEHCRVYLPQRDGVLLADELRYRSDAEGIADEIFAADSAAIRDATLLVAVLSGAAVDDGVAFEMGLAIGLGVPCVGLLSDSRRRSGYFRNPMWSGALAAAFDDEHSLVAWIAGWLRGAGASGG